MLIRCASVRLARLAAIRKLRVGIACQPWPPQVDEYGAREAQSSEDIATLSRTSMVLA
jgi:hypothetical protein